MASDGAIAGEGVPRKHDPICQACFDKGKAVPFIGQKDFTQKGRANSMAKRRGTGRLKSKTQQQVARRQLDHGPQGPGAGGGAVASLLKAKALGMWTGGSNSRCRQCGEGGEVCRTMGPLNRRSSPQAIRNWPLVTFYFPSCRQKKPAAETGSTCVLPI